MASTELVVAFSAQVQGLETSLKRVNTRLDEIQNKSAATAAKMQGDVNIMSSAFNALATNLGRALAAYVAFSTVRSLAQVAVAVDDINASLTRMRVLTGSTQSNVESLFASFNKIGSQTGQSVSSLADQFTRFYVATASIGASQSSVQQLVETLARFAQIGGRGPQEAAAAITQLSQGLASGRLNGDELRSILENMPLLAQALARELNVNVGELRKMGEEGRLTAEVVFPALLRAGAALSATLTNVPLNLRQSFQVATDGLLRAIREADRAIGATEFMGRLLRSVGEGGQRLAIQIGGPQNEEERVALATREREQSMQNIATLTQQIEASERRLATLTNENARRAETVRLNTLELARQNARVALQTAASENSGPEAGGQGFPRTPEDIRRSAQAIVEGERQAQQEIDRIRGTFDERERVRQDAAKRRREANALAARNVDRETIDGLIAGINREEAEKLASIARQEGAEGRRQASTDRAARARALEEQRALDAQVRAITGLDRSPIRDMEDRFRAISETPTGRLQSSIGVFLDRVREGTQSLDTLFGSLETNAERAATELTRAGQDPAEAFTELNRQVEVLRQAMAAKGIDTSGLEAQFQGATDRINDKLTRLRDRTESTWNDIAVKGAQTFSQELAGGLIDFVTTGEQKFDELAANFAKNIAKMILQLLIFQATASVLSSQFGIRIPGFANGGATGRRPIIVGERGPELFSPASSGYITPNHDIGGGGTTVNVYNQSSNTQTRQQERSNGLGGKEVDIYIEDIVRRGINDGRFDGVMGQSFGASRRGRV